MEGGEGEDIDLILPLILLKGRIRSEANREGPLVNTDSKLEGAPEREGDTGAGPGPVT